MEDFRYNPARPKQRENFMLTNFVSNFDDLDRPSITRMIHDADKQNINKQEPQSKSLLHRIGFYMNLANPIEWSFLFTFSVSVTIFLVTLDSLIVYGIEKRKNMISNPDLKIFNLLFWVVSSVFFFLIATSVGFFISPDADGSGTPEMKTVLSGINIYKYLFFI